MELCDVTILEQQFEDWKVEVDRSACCEENNDALGLLAF
jgi:hypothetical protein